MLFRSTVLITTAYSVGTLVLAISDSMLANEVTDIDDDSDNTLVDGDGDILTIGPGPVTVVV